ncbi:hypothetical protein SAMN05444274_11063 [Mariniphaga anaerophila]|uniref:YbbR-like protein n=1 Tax=Mariniphaga anaerophila TaxID=1484053 RepID=A0A1M5EX07_9BACT|nr:hypothetical protein [Mariniphaga anaerophila]SHF83727.1 hypothetical protein SAMN05444274_11063 [Mariniphaga anaerophila]
MNKKITEILTFFNREKLRNDKRIVVFAICLLIATSLWFLNALNKDYTTELTYSVKYVNPPKNLFLANTPPTKIDLNVQAHGFTLLRHKLAFSFSPVILDLSAISQSMGGASNEYKVPSEILIRRISDQVSKEISINAVSPQTITLVFDSMQIKKLPVLPKVSLEFEQQFFLKGVVTATPDSIEIAGPAALLDTLTVLPTEARDFKEVNKSLEKIVPIIFPQNTKVSPEKVTISIPVEKFTEKKLTIPIQGNNVPQGVDLKLFPPQITVTVMVGLNEYENVSPHDFTASVDYQQALSGNNALDVSVKTGQSFIQLIKVVPASVEYLIETE